MAGKNAEPDQICVAENVIVEGKPAVWIFSEFETDEPLPGLVAWLKPQDWPKWGSRMFKKMTQLGDRTNVRADAGKQWHAKFLEVVSLMGVELNTVLSCDFRQTADWAAMTYDLDHSVGNVLEVDRGFLLAVDVAGRRQVKALKIVGFTNTVIDIAATTVCPDWTDWIREATKEAERRDPSSGTDPTHGAVGDDTGGASRRMTDDATAFTQGYASQWVECVSGMADFYGRYTTDVGSRLLGGDYKQKDAAEDSTRLFWRLARDWSRAWQAGAEVMARVAEADVPPVAGDDPAGGQPQRTTEYTTVLVPSPPQSQPVAVTDFRRIAVHSDTLAASAFRVEPTEIGPDGDTASVRIEAETTNVPAGLYEGNVLVGRSGSQRSTPALFYAGKARRTA
jgi:hypothetical protein